MGVAVFIMNIFICGSYSRVVLLPLTHDPCGDYSRAATIRSVALFEDIQYIIYTIYSICTYVVMRGRIKSTATHYIRARYPLRILYQQYNSVISETGLNRFLGR